MFECQTNVKIPKRSVEETKQKNSAVDKTKQLILSK